MGLVNLTIRNNVFQIACDDGQEESLRDLAHGLDKRLSELAKSYSKANDKMLYVMALLMAEDEKSNLKRQNEDMKFKMQAGGKLMSGEASSGKAVAEALDAISDYVENLAKRVEKL